MPEIGQVLMIGNSQLEQPNGPHPGKMGQVPRGNFYQIKMSRRHTIHKPAGQTGLTSPSDTPRVTRNRKAERHMGWIRDLTREGIEPNPGPNGKGKKNPGKKKKRSNGLATNGKNGTAAVGNAGVSPKVKTTLKQSGNSTIQWGQDHCVVTGTDYLAAPILEELGTLLPTSTVSQVNKTGAIVMTQMINPWRFPGTRLFQFANLFQKFYFLECSIQFISAVPATTAGQWLCAFDNDPTFMPVGGPQAVLRTMMAHKGRRLAHVFENWEMRAPPVVQKDFYCDARGMDLRLNNQAIFIASLASPIKTQTGENLQSNAGTFVLKWKVRFSQARIETPTTGLKVDNSFTAIFESLTSSNNLRLTSGSLPNTRVSIMILAHVDNTPGEFILGAVPGAVYYLSLEASAGTGLIGEGNVFNTLKGATDRDPNDIVDWQKSATSPNMVFTYIPVGPPTGKRAGDTTPTIALATTLSGTNDIIQCQLSDPRFQADAYLMKYDGCVHTGGSQNVAAVITSEQPDGQTVVPSQQVLYTKVESLQLFNHLGCSEDEFEAAYGQKPKLGFVIATLAAVAQIVGPVGLISLEAMRVIKNAVGLVELSLKVVRAIENALDNNNPYKIPYVDLHKRHVAAVIGGTYHLGYIDLTFPFPREHLLRGEKEEMVGKGHRNIQRV